MQSTVLLTGAAGRIGGYLRHRLARPERTLRLLDVRAVPDAGAARAGVEQVVRASVTDLAGMTAAATGADAVVHLGGIAGEASWEDLLDVNIRGAHTVFEAARRAGVPRVVFASSNHAVGFHRQTAGELPDDLPPRPDSFYGVSKVCGEALGSLYHDRYGLDVVCLRLGSCVDRPTDARTLETWLSPDDAGRLVEACLGHPAPGFVIAWGVSANTRRRWSLREARRLGYEPRDDAERYAGDLPGTDPAAREGAPVGGSLARPAP
jgi:nucleoside-diphosphate-sugar epimerase